MEEKRDTAMHKEDEDELERERFRPRFSILGVRVSNFPRNTDWCILFN